MQTAAKFWDAIAPKYAKSPIRDVPAYEYTLGRTRTYLHPSDRVLELGCGTGGTALKLADATAQITATDLSEKMLEVGRRNAAISGTGNVSFEQADQMTAPKGPFDVVMAFNLLHLIEDTDQALAQIHSRLKPGGLFISKTPCQPDRRPPLSYRLIRIVLPLLQWIGKAPFVKFMAVRDWDRAVADAGFQIIESGNHPAHPPARYLVARRI